MPNIKELQIQQRKLLIRYLTLQKEFPENPAVKILVREIIAEMDEEDVLWVKARLFEDGGD